MITAHFDKHDLLYCIEGFAHGSHLRQHIWDMVVSKFLPQMKDDETDFIWFYLRRDVWDTYFGKYGSCGKEDFLHAMAALHRGNRAKVKFHPDGNRKKTVSVLCYRFNGLWRPLPSEDTRARFTSFIPNEWISKAERLPMPDNECVEYAKMHWWNDLEIYDKPIEDIGSE